MLLPVSHELTSCTSTVGIVGNTVARDAASAELELDQLQEVQLAFQKMDLYSGAPGSIYQSLAEAMGWLLTWLKGKADGGALPSKGYDRYEGVWAGHQVCSCNEVCH